MITHAHVRFSDDKVVKTVKADDILNFMPSDDKDFVKDKLYRVKWYDTVDPEAEPEIYKAQILLLGESEVDVAEKLKVVGRFRFPAVMKRSCSDISTTDDAGKDEGKQLRRQTKKNKAMIIEAQEKTSSNILKKKKKLMKSRIVMNSSAESDGPNNVEVEKDNWKEKCQKLENTLAEAETKLKKQKARLQEYQDLNERLQKQLLQQLEVPSRQTTFIKTPGKSVEESEIYSNKKVHSELINAKMEKVDVPSPKTSDWQISPFRDPLDDKEEQYISDDSIQIPTPKKDLSRFPDTPSQIGNSTQVNLGDGVFINKNAWETIQHKNDSLFVKDLAVAIWGSHALQNRSLDGKGTTRLQNRSPRKMLTPKKYKVLKDCYYKRLEKQGLTGAALEKSVKGSGRYLTEKINDLIKREKKKTCATVNAEKTTVLPSHGI